ncbi:MAG: hypothetical protein WC680_10920 [Sulfuricurvum sp.]
MKIDVSQECRLKNPSLMHHVKEISLFKVNIENKRALPEYESIKEILLWADGKTYLINSNNANQKNISLNTDDIKSIDNAKFLKLLVTYQNQANEKNQSNGTTDYRKTVEKKQYFPIVMEQSAINNAIIDCRKSVDTEKTKFWQLKFYIAIGLIGGTIGLSLISKRLERDQ